MRADKTRYPVHYLVSIRCFGHPGQQVRVLSRLAMVKCPVVDFRAWHASREGGALSHEDHNMIFEAIFADETLALPILCEKPEDEKVVLVCC